MDRTEFLRAAIRTFIEPATVWNVHASEGKHILEALAETYVSKAEFIQLMIAEGFMIRQTAPVVASFRAKYRCNVSLLLNQHWTREHIRSQFGQRQFERWDSICDAILLLKLNAAPL